MITYLLRYIYIVCRSCLEVIDIRCRRASAKNCKQYVVFPSRGCVSTTRMYAFRWACAKIIRFTSSVSRLVSTRKSSIRLSPTKYVLRFWKLSAPVCFPSGFRRKYIRSASVPRFISTRMTSVGFPPKVIRFVSVPRGVSTRMTPSGCSHKISVAIPSRGLSLPVCFPLGFRRNQLIPLPFRNEKDIV